MSHGNCEFVGVSEKLFWPESLLHVFHGAESNKC